MLCDHNKNVKFVVMLYVKLLRFGGVAVRSYDESTSGRVLSSRQVNHSSI